MPAMLRRANWPRFSGFRGVLNAVRVGRRGSVKRVEKRNSALKRLRENSFLKGAAFRPYNEQSKWIGFRWDETAGLTGS